MDCGVNDTGVEVCIDVYGDLSACAPLAAGAAPASAPAAATTTSPFAYTLTPTATISGELCVFPFVYQ